jgi:hypothetical protein
MAAKGGFLNLEEVLHEIEYMKLNAETYINQNALQDILIEKGIITRADLDARVNHLKADPQATLLFSVLECSEQLIKEYQEDFKKKLHKLEQANGGGRGCLPRLYVL